MNNIELFEDFKKKKSMKGTNPFPSHQPTARNFIFVGYNEDFEDTTLMMVNAKSEEEALEKIKEWMDLEEEMWDDFINENPYILKEISEIDKL